MSDLITEIEQSLALFTERLSQGLDSVCKQSLTASEAEKGRLRNAIVSDLSTTHRKILAMIEKLPEGMLGESRHQQEVEIEELQRELMQVTGRLERVQEQAKEVSSSLRASLEQMKTA